MRQREQQRFIPGAQEHLNALGFPTVEAYQRWCVQLRLRPGLRKGSKEKARECALRHQEAVVLQQEWQRTQRRQERAQTRASQVLYELSRGTAGRRWANTYPHFWELKPYFSQARRDRYVQEAFLHLVDHMQERWTGPSLRAIGFGRELPRVLLAFAGSHKHWLQPLESWQPETDKPALLWRALARHLFCRYPVPAFLDSVWLEDGPEQHRWFRWVGEGKSLRELALPLPLTAQMRHCFLAEVPEHIVHWRPALRWAQVRGLGGSPELASTVVQTVLGTTFRDEPFWESALRLLVGSGTLPLRQVGPLIDYLAYERFEPREPGDDTRLPVGFTMKGRTIPALLERMEAWHYRLRWKAQFPREHWAPSGVIGLNQEAICPVTGKAARWEVVELHDARSLVLEGEAMHHCVASYGRPCIQRQAVIFGLRLHIGETVQRVMTLRLDSQRTLVEARGKYNASLAWGTGRLCSDETALLTAAAAVLRDWARVAGLTIAAGVL